MKKLFIRGIKDTMVTGLFALLCSAYPVIMQVTLGANWLGVDESVVEHYAEKAGRSARIPFINTDQGDLLLFVFLLAGAIGGFIIGYYWRILFKDTERMWQEQASSKRALSESKSGDNISRAGD